MQVRTGLAATVLALGASAAMAAPLAEFEAPDLGTSVRARADVRAEAAQAVQTRFHATPAGEFTADIDTTPSPATRTQVRADWWKELSALRKLPAQPHDVI